MNWVEACKWLYSKLLVALTTPAGGVGVFHEFENGNEVEKEREERAAKLYALCQEATDNPAWFQREDGTTYCNRAAGFIAQGCGYFGFRHGMLANEMIAHLEQEASWREDSFERAAKHANRGGLAFLTMKHEPHGHIAAVAPGELQDSGAWGCAVPLIANVGIKGCHGIVRASYAFKAADKDRVKAFVYMGEIL